MSSQDAKNEPRSITVNLAGEYPIFKRDGDKLVRLPAQNAGRRYSLATNLQGETYYVEFTDQEEAQADIQKAEWEAGAPEREAEARRQAEEAQRFEEALIYKNRVVAFLDILGWKHEVLSKDSNVIRILGRTLASFQATTRLINSGREHLPKDLDWPGDAVMTHFSDCIVLSVKDDEHGRGDLEFALSALTSNLMQFGFLLRGGVSRGELFHEAGLVFGPALVRAYELESEVAVHPRVILSEELSAEWGGRTWNGNLPWIPSDDGYLFFNFLPPFLDNPFFSSNEQLLQNRLTPVRELILRKARDSACSERVYSKYRWLASYFDRVCDDHADFELERVALEADRVRLTTCLPPA